VRIGDVAARAGVSPRALRYYEEQQLLPAVRSASGQRHYPDSAVDRVRLIQQLYAAGLGSKAILELLPCVHTGIVTPAMLARMSVERDRIDQQVRELTRTRDRLDDIISAAQRVGQPCALAPSASSETAEVAAAASRARRASHRSQSRIAASTTPPR